MRLCFQRLILFCLFLLVLSPCALAGAAPSAADVKRAAEAFDRGREAFRAESYVEAAEHFEAADAYAPSAAALRLAIAARKAAGQLDRAMTLSSLALTSYADDEALRAEAEEVLSASSQDFGQIVVSCDEPCELTLDSKIVHGPKTRRHTVYVVPGSHEVQGTWSKERTYQETITVVAGESRATDFYAPPLPEVPPPVALSEGTSGQEDPAEPAVEERAKGWSPAVFWTGAALTGVGLALTSYLGVKAINEPGQQRVIDECPDTDCDLYREGVANQTAANVAGGVTAAVGVFTIVTAVWLTNWSGKKQARLDDEKREDGWSFRRGAFSVQPKVSIGDGATLGASGTF